MESRMKDKGRRMALSVSEGMKTLLLALGALLLLASIVGAQAGASPGAWTLLPSTALPSAPLPSTPLGTSGTSGTSGTGSASYDLSWFTVDGGGAAFSTNGGYTLGGTLGQPDTGPVLANGGYTLAGGFWGGAAAQYNIYLPVVLRG